MRKIVLFFITLSIAFALIGCQEKSDETVTNLVNEQRTIQPTMQPTPTKDNIIEKKPLDYKNLYANVIDRYKDVIKQGNSFDMPNDIAFTVYEDIELKGKFSYALYDIDNNGIPEMIINDDKDGIVGLYAIDTKNKKAVRLFADYYETDYLCGRSPLTIFPNGYLTISGSEGASVHSYCQYKMDDTGYKIKLVFSSKENLDVNNDSTRDENPTISTVGKEVNLEGVSPINLESLSWTVFAN